MQFKLVNRQICIQLWPTLLISTVFLLMLKAGFWQLDKAAQKIAIQQQFTQAKQHQQTLLIPPLNNISKYLFKNIKISGQYNSQQQFLLDNQFDKPERHAQPGYAVITPLQLSDGKILLVNRGWLPLGGDRQQLPDIYIDKTLRNVQGIIHQPNKGFNLGDIDTNLQWPRVIQYIDYAILSQRLQREIYPAILMLAADQPDGYTRNWQLIPAGPDRHYGYAFQWFTMALVLLLIALKLAIKPLTE